MRFAVKRYWEVCDDVEVEANSVGEAIEAAHEMPLDSTKAEFVPDSLNSDSFCDVQFLTADGEWQSTEDEHETANH